jgi:hypothetical protein
MSTVTDVLPSVMARLKCLFLFNLWTNYNATILVESIKILYNSFTEIIPYLHQNNKTYVQQ